METSVSRIVDSYIRVSGIRSHTTNLRETHLRTLPPLVLGGIIEKLVPRKEVEVDSQYANQIWP
jgi:hypothetical protein